MQVGDKVILEVSDSEQHMKYLGVIVAQDLNKNLYRVGLQTGNTVYSDGSNLTVI